MTAEIPVPGVVALDHTADVGIAVEAPDLPQLFARAAAGMAYLILEHDPPPPTEERRVEVRAADRSALLREWLRELLFWHETEGFSFASVVFEALDESRLRATVAGGPDPTDPVREIKGVTLHQLAVERTDGGWRARVIFDV